MGNWGSDQKQDSSVVVTCPVAELKLDTRSLGSPTTQGSSLGDQTRAVGPFNRRQDHMWLWIHPWTHNPPPSHSGLPLPLPLLRVSLYVRPAERILHSLKETQALQTGHDHSGCWAELWSGKSRNVQEQGVWETSDCGGMWKQFRCFFF